MVFVYILRTIDDQLYVGSTRDLSQRLNRHRKGFAAAFTRAHQPAALVYSEQHPTLVAARRREAQIKKWTRAKKEALLTGDVKRLKKL